MDPISALSLACSVMQVVSFSQETAATCARIYKSGELDPGLGEKYGSLQRVYQDLDSGLKAWDSVANRPGVTEAEASLRDNAGKILQAATDLKQDVDKIAVHKGSVRGSLHTGILAWRRRRRIEKVDEKMQHYRQLLETRLLIKIW